MTMLPTDPIKTRFASHIRMSGNRKEDAGNDTVPKRISTVAIPLSFPPGFFQGIELLRQAEDAFVNSQPEQAKGILSGTREQLAGSIGSDSPLTQRVSRMLGKLEQGDFETGKAGWKQLVESATSS